MKRTNIIVGIIFLAVSIYAGVVSYDLEVGTLASPEAGFIPLVVSLLLSACSCIFIVLALRGRLKPGETAGGRASFLHIAGFVVLSMAYLALLYLLGIWIATIPALMLLYWKSGGRGLLRSAAFAVLAMAFSYLLFSVALKVEFPKGLLLG